MTTKNYTPDSFANEFGRDARKHAAAIMVEFHREMHAEAGEIMERLTPLGSPDTDGQSMVKRWGDRIGRRDTVPASPRASLSKIKLGSTSARINDDAGAAAIDHGRKRNHYKNFSRMGGSPQAPRGISKPAKEHVLNKAEAIASRAIKHADAKFGRR